MAKESNIEWTDATWNPWIGCTKISPACDHCYAEVATASRSTAARLGIDTLWGPGIHRYRTSQNNWDQPRLWNDAHDEFFATHGRRRRVFTLSLGDIFDSDVPAQWRADVFRVIRQTPNLDWLLLTKRIGNANRLIREALEDGHLLTMREEWPWRNLWLGITVVNQEEFNRDVPKLLNTPARIRFLSIEPMLERIDLFQVPPLKAVDWVIAGGESGPASRPVQSTWMRLLRLQCATAGVPFLFKQWGEWIPDDQVSSDTMSEHLRTHRAAVSMRINGQQHWKLGKKAAGRLLDGREHNGVPT